MTARQSVAAVGEGVLRHEAQALLSAADRFHAPSFERAVSLVTGCEGKVLTIGAGTSGIIARKLAATFTSTGTPSIFLHPSDALHGGLGAVETGDVVLAISNSGETGELLVMLPYLRSRHVALLAIVGNVDSSLARAADSVLDASVQEEAGPLGLAPTSSSTLALAVGDALAMAVLARSNFTQEAFARNHPSGRLGRRLTLRVEDILSFGLPRPAVAPHETLMAAIEKIGAGGVGAVLVLEDDVLVGLITDGDVRRALLAGVTDPLSTTVEEVMTKSPEWVALGTLAYDALQRMEDRKSQISVLPVVDVSARKCVGVIRVHDLVRAGI
jgi:arabinose-5-phosphate isomerase